MVAPTNQVTHKMMVSRDQQQWQRQGIKRDGHQRFKNILQPAFGMFQSITTSQKGAAQKKTALAPMERHDFISDRFVAPDESMSFGGEAAEKIEILTAGPEFLTERDLEVIQNFPAKEHVTGAASAPFHVKSGLMPRPMIEAAFLDPPGWFAVEMRDDRPEDGHDGILLAGSKELEKPILHGKFVIIDEGGKFALGVSQGAIADEGEILDWFNAIDNLQSRACSETGNQIPSGGIGIIVGDDGGKGKKVCCFLSGECIKQTPEEVRAFEGADANGDVHGGQKSEVRGSEVGRRTSEIRCQWSD